METNEQIKIENYFSNREVDTSYYGEYKIPRYLKHVLPSKRNAKVLDIGCGFGQFLGELKQLGYTSLKGIDINDEAINACKNKGLDVTQISDIVEFAKNSNTKYDFISMSHVLEHIEKSKIIDTLIHIKKYL
ncbi:MAG: class I SAM-dependent methyltransferase, partial [Bacteroidetes bacterium]|nr:class I SAM-dependent methyltransferase [Bacteroidota bacterium]